MPEFLSNVDFDAHDAALDGLIALGNGIVAKTAAGTLAARTLTGTSNQVTVTNGDGVSGNPTLSLPQDYHTAARPTLGGLDIVGNTNGVVSFAVLNSNAGSNAQVQTSAGNSDGDLIYFGHTSRAFTAGSPVSSGRGFLLTSARPLAIGTQAAEPVYVFVGSALAAYWDAAGIYTIDTGASGDQFRIGHGANFYKWGRNTGTGYLDVTGTQAGYTGLNLWGLSAREDGTLKPVSLAAASAVSDSIFRDTADGKLKYKDQSGTVNSLY